MSQPATEHLISVFQFRENFKSAINEVKTIFLFVEGIQTIDFIRTSYLIRITHNLSGLCSVQLKTDCRHLQTQSVLRDTSLAFKLTLAHILILFM